MTALATTITAMTMASKGTSSAPSSTQAVSEIAIATSSSATSGSANCATRRRHHGTSSAGGQLVRAHTLQAFDRSGFVESDGGIDVAVAATSRHRPPRGRGVGDHRDARRHVSPCCSIIGHVVTLPTSADGRAAVTGRHRHHGRAESALSDMLGDMTELDTSDTIPASSTVDGSTWIVGCDDSENARHALDWAAYVGVGRAVAGARGRGGRESGIGAPVAATVTSTHRPATPRSSSVVDRRVTAARAGADRLDRHAHRGGDAARRARPRVLLDAAHHDDVGPRGRRLSGPWRLPATVARFGQPPGRDPRRSALRHRARRRHHRRTLERVVVGVDGSDTSVRPWCGRIGSPDPTPRCPPQGFWEPAATGYEGLDTSTWQALRAASERRFEAGCSGPKHEIGVSDRFVRAFDVGPAAQGLVDSPPIVTCSSSVSGPIGACSAWCSGRSPTG